ncbi:MAG: Histidinol dehydrogenase [SAR116 cluster bacterium MED-G04]|jgi:histidinol dehydrogenase|nr:MAG: Histidinol dehydrogenase [SAR116 cluster bacterium MED-G04]|tara:strand:- start:1934 stop:3229 length:1296 start_codon:yes stop_codon:yes gene_type:complete
MPSRLDSRSPDFEGDFGRLLTSKREDGADVSETVSGIIRSIRGDGDAALLELTRRFDQVDVETVADLAVDADTMDAALGRIDAEVRDALEAAASRIRGFHEKQFPDDLAYTDAAGVQLGLRHTPVDAAGLYVPGGKAAYPSSVLMNAIPAEVAGVGRRVMVVPTPQNAISDTVLAAARIAGITEIWRIGGAQAIAALAYGTETIAPVDKIVGPGNAYVATAKRQVFGQVGIDSIAGPSEILVLADAGNNPDWIAMDLLSQAEHDEAAQAILITDDAGFADAVGDAVDAILPQLERAEIAGASWRDHGAIITVHDWNEGAALANRLAAEHLEIATDNAEELSGMIRHAGAIFLGRWTPEAVGDYVGGPNHVLPTARTSRFSSGLGVLDFMKRTTTLGCDADSLAEIGRYAVTLAKAEGLEAHGLSISKRLNR